MRTDSASLTVPKLGGTNRLITPLIVANVRAIIIHRNGRRVRNGIQLPHYSIVTMDGKTGDVRDICQYAPWRDISFPHAMSSFENMTITEIGMVMALIVLALKWRVIFGYSVRNNRDWNSTNAETRKSNDSK